MAKLTLSSIEEFGKELQNTLYSMAQEKTEEIKNELESAKQEVTDYYNSLVNPNSNSE